MAQTIKPILHFFDSLLDFILPKFHLTPTRFDILLWSFIIWAGLLTEENTRTIIDTTSISFPFFALEFKRPLTSPIFLKFGLAAFLSCVSHLSLRAFMRSSFGYLRDANPEDINSLVELLNTKSGIQKIYRTSHGSPAISQSYSAEVLKTFQATKKVRLLSIAGYEYIGKGESHSLFYDFFKQNSWMKLEIVILDPNASTTINERIAQLKKTDVSYTAQKLKDQILATTEKCRQLNACRGNDNSIELYYCQFHPIFRLIAMDDVLFMSTYETDCHGHESPVYKIDKANSPEKLSLYSSFTNLFEKIKNNSNRVQF